MKTKTPLRQWFEDERWSSVAVAAKTGLSKYTIHAHQKGKAWPSKTAISAYKVFGVPVEVIREHLSWMADRA